MVLMLWEPVTGVMIASGFQFRGEGAGELALSSIETHMWLMGFLYNNSRGFYILLNPQICTLLVYQCCKNLLFYHSPYLRGQK